MPSDDKSNRTEPATPRRREQARQRGQVAKSAELSGVLFLLGALLFLRYYVPHFLEDISALFYWVWSKFPTELNSAWLYAYTLQLFLYIIRMVGPILIVVVLLGLVVNVIQVGVLFTGYPLVPKLDRLNPVEGFKRLFSKRILVQTLINVFKVMVVGTVIYSALKNRIDSLIVLVDVPLSEALMFWGKFLFDVLMKILGFLLIIAIMDYIYNRWEYEKSLMMTKEELKEELKQMEGDPQVRARIRRIQRELARQRMMKEVETADVVITNPTHIAVALRYNPEKDSAPVVVAKGMRLLAEKIKEIAIANGVPIVENVSLARALYKLVEVGETIPEKLYRAVAEVLAYVYRLKRRATI